METIPVTGEQPAAVGAIPQTSKTIAAGKIEGEEHPATSQREKNGGGGGGGERNKEKPQDSANLVAASGEEETKPVLGCGFSPSSALWGRGPDPGQASGGCAVS